MKVNPEMGNVINVISKGTDERYTKTSLQAKARESVEDIVSVENKQASRSRLETVEEAKKILSYVTGNMEGVSSRLYNLNEQRISRIIS